MAETAFSLEQEVKPEPPVGSGAPPMRLVETPSQSTQRPQARGKFLFVGEEKFWIKGVTYGTFNPDEDGHNYPPPDIVEADFAAMAASGINTVRLYTVPPRWLLDSAQAQGLRVMVGLPWEQHITFLDTKKRANDIEGRVRDGIRACAGHPALLCYSVGNEIPASIVRWYGHRRIERFIKRLYQAAKDEDPGGLVTYVNFPTTEYLDLSFVDLFTFNVYLEDNDRLSAYLKRLHNIAGDKPMVLAEVGLDTLRHGEAKQSEVLEWQIRTCFAEGCCGVFVFAWTDEWHRGGYDIEDWNFGLTTRDRKPKPALDTVHHAFEAVRFPGSRRLRIGNDPADRVVAQRTLWVSFSSWHMMRPCYTGIACERHITCVYFDCFLLTTGNRREPNIVKTVPNLRRRQSSAPGVAPQSDT